MHYKIAQLMLSPKKKTGMTSHIFVAQPNANKEALAGKLFFLMEIESNKSDGFKIVNFLIDNLNSNYYQNEKIILREKISTLKVEHIFESALAKTNKSLIDFLRNGRIKINPGSINITTGVIYEDNLYFTSIGNNKALLIYKNKNLEESQFNIVDVAEQAKSEQNTKKLNLTKLFTNVISGAIPKGGYFIFTNETLPEYLSNKQLIDIVTSLPPASAAEQIKNILSKVNAYVPFLSIIIKNTTGLKIAEPIKSTLESTTLESLNKLNTTEEKTEKLLTSAGIKTKTTKFSPAKLLSGINAKFSRVVAKNPEHSALKDKILFKKHNSWISLSNIINFIKNFFAYFIKFIVHLFRKKNYQESATDETKPKKIKSDKTFSNFINNSSKSLFYWHRKLSKKNKFLIIIALVILILLAQNLLIVNVQNKKVEQEQAYYEITNKINQKQNQVEASLLYNNEADAKKYLDEMNELISQLPKNNDEQMNQYNEFKNKYNEQLEKIQHIIKIIDAEKLVDFTKLNSSAKPANLVYIGKNNKLYVADYEQKSIYSYSLDDNLPTAITELNINIDNLNYPCLDSQNNIYYFNNNNILEFNTGAEELKQFNIALPESSKIISMANFNDRLYLLDNSNSQIYRYNKLNNSYGGKINWLENNYDLTNAVSMFIDGYIYVLKNNGTLLKYFKGQQQKFDLELNLVEPKIENATKVMVSIEDKYIYIFEASKKRLVIFDKKGQFLNQYIYEQFNEILDYAVDEFNKKIYILDKTSVYELEARHIN